MGKDFISEPTTHIRRGYGEAHQCEWCGWNIRIGEEYERWVECYGNRSFFVCHAHANHEDCPQDEESVTQEMWEESFATVAQPIEMVLTNKIVALVGLNGETVFSTEPVMEMRIGRSNEPKDEPDDSEPFIPTDTKDEIPF